MRNARAAEGLKAADGVKAKAGSSAGVKTKAGDGLDGAKTKGAGNARKELMAIAIDCFARFGYQGTSIDRIARDAGVTKGAVYYHFRDKEELLFEAVKDRIGGFEQHVLDKVTPTQDALTRLREVVDACFFHATVSNHRRFIITLMIEALDTNPRLSAEFRDILRRMRTFVTTVIRRGQQRGTLRPEVAAVDRKSVV